MKYETMRRAVRRFEIAVENQAFSGSYHPDDRPLCQAEYDSAKRALLDKIARLVRNEE